MNVTGELHVPAALPEGQNSGMYRIGGWLSPRTDVDAFGEKSLASVGIRTLDLPIP